MTNAPVSGFFTPHHTHEIAYRVYYEDTDAAGIMYYANYLKFAERARTEALRLAGIEQSAMLARGEGGFVVRRATVEYHAPAALDDVVVVETRVESFSKLRLTMRQRLLRAERVLASLEVEIVMMGAAGKPQRIPDSIRELLLAHLKENNAA